MNKITQGFINSIGGKTDTEYRISTDCEHYNGVIYATLWIAQEMAKEVKGMGYSKSWVIDNKTGEVVFEA